MYFFPIGYVHQANANEKHRTPQNMPVKTFYVPWISKCSFLIPPTWMMHVVHRTADAPWVCVLARIYDLCLTACLMIPLRNWMFMKIRHATFWIVSFKGIMPRYATCASYNLGFCLWCHWCRKDVYNAGKWIESGRHFTDHDWFVQFYGNKQAWVSIQGCIVLFGMCKKNQ